MTPIRFGDSYLEESPRAQFIKIKPERSRREDVLPRLRFAEKGARKAPFCFWNPSSRPPPVLHNPGAECGHLKKEFTMDKYWIVRVVGVVLLLIGVVAVAGLAYAAGQSQVSVPAAAEAVSAVPARGYWGPMHLLGALPFLLCLAPLFLGLFICLPFRMIFGPRRHAWHMHGRCGRWGEGDIPEPVRKFHDRLHENDRSGNAS
jgi:hypothetical protein